MDAVAGVYAEVLRRFAKLGAQWVQLDEPYLMLDKHEGDVSLFKSLYSRLLPARDSGVKVLLNTYFGNITDIYETVKLFEFDGVGLDLIEGRDENLKAVEHHGVAARTTLFAGVVNGRNIWRNNYAESIALVEALQQVTANVAVASACSLLHVPFSTKGEEQLGDKVLRHFAFAVEKLEEVREIADLVQLDDDAKRQSTALAANQAVRWQPCGRR